jgi:hypothetical protein
MYSNQVFLIMHHRLALLTLNLGQPTQGVPLKGKKEIQKIILFSQFII